MENANNLFPSIPLTSLVSVSKIHSLYYYEFPKDYLFKGETHDFWELIYADKGDCFVQNGDERIILKSGEAALVSPNVFHMLGGNGTNIFNVFVISFSCKSKAVDAMMLRSFRITPPQRELISKIIKEGRRAFYLPTIDDAVSELFPRENALLGSRQLVKNYLEELLISFLRVRYQDNDSVPVLSVLSSKITNPKNLIESVEKYLLDNLEKPVSITAICETFHYSKNYICSHFKQQTGYTVIEYFNRARIERAKELIREHNHSLSAISELLGFSSSGYFSKTFKRITGMSPQEYQRSLNRLLG